jgi:hypothetical protein
LSDAIGTWPYSSSPGSAELPQLRQELADRGLVTFRAFLNPALSVPVEAFVAAGFQVTPIKEHFVFEPALGLAPWSARTRRNLQRARSSWHVREIALAEHQHEVAEYHQSMLARKNMVGAIASLPPAHFAALTITPGFVTLGAFDQEGLGAALITAQHGQEVHYHALATVPRANRSGGCYALFASALDRWGPTSTLYLGGMPAGPDGPGVGRFKGRFSNRTKPLYMVSLVVNRTACEGLVAARGRQAWFPPYRMPGS